MSIPLNTFGMLRSQCFNLKDINLNKYREIRELIYIFKLQFLFEKLSFNKYSYLSVLPYFFFYILSYLDAGRVFCVIKLIS